LLQLPVQLLMLQWEYTHTHARVHSHLELTCKRNDAAGVDSDIPEVIKSVLHEDRNYTYPHPSPPEICGCGSTSVNYGRLWM